jgi:hypothetical protein
METTIVDDMWAKKDENLRKDWIWERKWMKWNGTQENQTFDDMWVMEDAEC